MSNWGQTPIILLVYDEPIAFPEIQAFPEVCGYIPVSTEIRVVFPAPLGPRNPKIYPLSNLSEIGFKAIFSFSPLFPTYFLLKSRIIKGEAPIDVANTAWYCTLID